MKRENKKRNKIIIGLISLLFLMTVGYAAFQTNLNIKGTSKISSNWDIRITNVTSGASTGNGENAKTPTWTNLTASMEANLYEKGDAMEYEVTVENKGTFDAKLESISSSESNNEAIKITFSGYTKGEKLYKNSTQTIKVKIEYNKDFTGTPTSNSNEVSIDLNYGQAEGGTIEPSSDYLLTYDYRTNGGEGTSETAYMSSNESVDLSKKGKREGYTFVGWNTDKNAKSGLSVLNMPSEDTVLYAIYKKELKVTYSKGEGVTGIGKTEDSCNIYNNETECEITLPSITVSTGYNIDGWYNGSTKVGNQNIKINIKSNISLIGKSTPKIYTITYDKNYFENDLWQGTANIERYRLNNPNTGMTMSKTSSNDANVKGGEVFTLASTSGEGAAGLFYAPFTYESKVLDVGTKYTWSFFAKSDDISTMGYVGSEQGGLNSTNITNSWQKYSYTFTAKDNSNGYTAFYSIYGHFKSGFSVSVHSLEIMEGEPTYDTVSKEHGSTLGALPPVQRKGYTFVGWYTKPYGGEQVISATEVTKDMTLYAHYIVNQYDVVYEFNGATSTGSLPRKVTTTIPTNYEGPYILPNPTKSYVLTYNYNGATGGNSINNATSNYTFDGWYKDSGFTNQVLNTDVLTEANTQGLYAKWINTNIVLPTPTKTGYIFGGWYSDSGLTKKVGDAGSSYTPEADQTLYAKWYPIAANQLRNKTITTGDGLYGSNYEYGKYVYSGAKPANYIKFNDEMWRIVSVESDNTLKIIKDTTIGTISFEPAGERTTGYCSFGDAYKYGCNAWAMSSNFVNGTISGAVDKDASINKYLNETYYNSMSSTAKNLIITHTFDVGPASLGNSNLTNQIQMEKSVTWRGKIGLVTASDIVLANNNWGVCGTLALTEANYDICKNTNYLVPNTGQFLTALSPIYDSTVGVFGIYSSGLIHHLYIAGYTPETFPTVYLKADISLLGDGTESSPYTIIS